VKLVLGRAASRTIAALTHTYVTLPLADIAAQAGLGGAAEAEGAILRWVGVYGGGEGRDGVGLSL
jgi:COP9 signalosome complex subunit 3